MSKCVECGEVSDAPGADGWHVDNVGAWCYDCRGGRGYECVSCHGRGVVAAAWRRNESGMPLCHACHAEEVA